MTGVQTCALPIYNTVPLSLHGHLEAILKKGCYSRLRLDFSIENAAQTRAVIEYYLNLMAGTAGTFPYREFTNGHYKRGVE